MAETATLKLPLVAPAQAQKHVTVNEALARIDAALQLSVISRSLGAPPATPVEGSSYLVPLGAVNDWAGQEGLLAFALNGGWDFLDPQDGWRVFVRDEAVYAHFIGGEWRSNPVSATPFGAGMRAESIEFDFDVSAGATALTGFVIPEGAVVLAVTGRVVTAITGTLSDWSLGVIGSDNRYGSGYGLGAGSYMRGVTGQPQAYYSNTQLQLSANGGDFAAGTVRLAVHVLLFDLPNA